ncbi:MAG: fasciclin domain-containing protein [Sandaracinaceae bacterium]
MTTMNLNVLRLLTAGLLALALGACGGDATESSSAEATEPTGGAEATGGDEAGPGTIVDVAVGDGRFQTLVAAVQAAGLVDTLNSAGPFTVFAPTDDAFAALPEGTVDSLLQPENQEQLRAVLTYHVVAGAVPSSDVVNMTSATTVQGSDVPIAVEGGNVRVGTATVVIPDVQASNGVIHVIDAVLLPPQ